MFTDAEGITSPRKGEAGNLLIPGFCLKGREILLYQMALVVLICGERIHVLEGASGTETSPGLLVQPQLLTPSQGGHKGHCRVRNGDNHTGP